MATTLAASCPITTKATHVVPMLQVSCQPGLSTLCLLLADLTALLVPALLSAMVIRSPNWLLEESLATVCILLAFLLFGLYPGLNLHPVLEMRKVFGAATSIGAAGFCVTLKQPHVMHDLLIVGLWTSGMTLVPVTRGLARTICRKMSWWGRPVFVIGEESSATSVIQRLLRDPEAGLKPIAFFSEIETPAAEIAGVPVFQDLDLLDAMASLHDVRCVVVANPDALERRMIDRIEEKAPSLQRIVFASDAACPFSLEMRTSNLSRMLALEVSRNLLLPGGRLMKRALDVALTIPLVVAAAPLLLLIAIALKLESKGPVFFRHTRIGRNKRPFLVWKFRSMIPNGDAILRRHLAENPDAELEWSLTHKLQNDPRVTKLGAFLRSSSLDELPQLFNVLQGDMSLVGPRPITEAEGIRYGSYLGHYTNVCPGMTGMWQVSGRSDTTYEQRVELDTYYVRNWSVWLDLYLLSRTFSAVMNKQGAY